MREVRGISCLRLRCVDEAPHHIRIGKCHETVVQTSIVALSITRASRLSSRSSLVPLLGQQIVTSQQTLSHAQIYIVLRGTLIVGLAQVLNSSGQILLSLIQNITYGVTTLQSIELVKGIAISSSQDDGHTGSSAVDGAILIHIGLVDLGQIGVSHTTDSQSLTQQSFLTRSRSSLRERADDIICLGDIGIEQLPVLTCTTVVVFTVIEVIVIAEPVEGAYRDILAHHILGKQG